MKKKSDILDMPTIGYWSCFGGVEIKDIEFGINDYCLCVSGAWCGKKTLHKVMIYYNTSTPYIKLYGIRLKFNECLRV